MTSCLFAVKVYRILHWLTIRNTSSFKHKNVHTRKLEYKPYFMSAVSSLNFVEKVLSNDHHDVSVSRIFDFFGHPSSIIMNMNRGLCITWQISCLILGDKSIDILRVLKWLNIASISSSRVYLDVRILTIYSLYTVHINCAIVSTWHACNWRRLNISFICKGSRNFC